MTLDSLKFQPVEVFKKPNIQKKKLKILFYHSGINDWFYPAVLYFKTYIDLYHPDTAECLEWLIPIQDEKTDTELIDHIRSSGANVLCTSHYVWNHDFLINQLARIAPAIKNQVKIISGGPNIDFVNKTDFLEKNPYIDYAVYAAGEQALADIFSHLIFDKPMIAFNTSNCAWIDKKTNKTVVAQYKFVQMIQSSPYVHNEQFFTEMVQEFFKTHDNIWFPYELTRGCPYACTFCDWNSGLGNKVSRRKHTYQQEIDIFEKLGIQNIYLSDANVGQYQEDVDMIEYFVDKNLNHNAKFHIGGSFSKLNKENNLKIFHAMARGGLVGKTFNFSIQETNEEVLKNIDRPDVGWAVHAAMADQLRSKYPHLIVKAQMIYGLPGQTVKSWQQTLKTVTKKNIFPMVMFNEPLPLSPALVDPEYQRKFQFEYTYSKRLSALPGDGTPKFFVSRLTKKSISFDQKDLVQMNLISSIYEVLTVINLTMIENQLGEFDIDHYANLIIDSNVCKNLSDNFYHNWTVDNNFYYTINFNNESTIIPDYALGGNLAGNLKFLTYFKDLLPKEKQMPFIRLILQKKFAKTTSLIAKDFD